MEQKIFIVDDDPSVLRSLQRALEWRDFRVETYESARLFLDSYNSKRYGCLIVDVKMPGMSGLELQQELNERGMTLPVIFITGHGGAEESDVALRAGAIDFLEKPFDQEKLLQCIKRAFEVDASNHRAQ